MRPLKLEMEGFLAYRAPTTIDFSDAELFVLAGPTGAGKSSVIDAMTFVLYGTIPRLDDRRSVMPVISALSDRARLLYEFEVDGSRYVAARLVERTKTGARVTEARLEGPDGVIASGPDEVTEAVSELLGLRYEHFIKAVVLPQGAFAEFLRDRPSDRQAMLRALLDVGIFESIKVTANERAAAAGVRLQMAVEARAKLDIPTESDLETSRQRVAQLEGIALQLPDRVAKYETAAENSRLAKASAETAQTRLHRLEAVGEPQGLGQFTADRQRLEADLLEAAQSYESAVEATESIRLTVAELPSVSELDALLSRHAALAEKKKSIADLGLELKRQSVVDAEDELNAAVASLEQERHSGLVHQVQKTLTAGDKCPVCGNTVGEIDAGTDNATVRKSEKAVVTTTDNLRRAEAELHKAEGSGAELERSVEELEQALANALEPEKIKQMRGSVAKRLSEAEAAQDVVDRAKATLAAAEEQLRRHKGDEQRIRDALVVARDQVADEHPPLPVDDVVDSWTIFRDWKAELVGRLVTLAADTKTESEKLQTEMNTIKSELESWLRSAEIQPQPNAETAVAIALERSRAELESKLRAMAEDEQLAKEIDTETATERTARSLGNHLRSSNFEGWLLEEALQTLVVAANELLAELSGESYSLRIRNSQFEVVDHHNANAVRTTKSLSGGETFLVSLALALSMSKQLAALTGDVSRLESIFLDEGFGTLDDSSLDVVSSVLDELSSQGRTVGIVTHVKDLADRMPVRFEVSKQPDSSVVRRVET